MAWHLLVVGFYAYVGIATACLILGIIFTLREKRHYSGVARSLLKDAENKARQLIEQR